jgi:hypothetical protein
MGYFIFFLFAIVFAINVLIVYFKNFEDDRKDLGTFGGRK